MSRPVTLLTLLLTALVLGPAGCGQDAGERQAPQAREITRPSFEAFGDYIVHFHAQSTTLLTPEIARAAGIRRSGSRAMLNVAVLRRDENAELPVSAELRVAASNLLGQQKALELREVRDGAAIYYIGEMSVANEEIINFNVSVRPEGADVRHEFRFQQQFYRD